MTQAIVATGIKRRYPRGSDILRGVNFSACSGEVVGICGPNGAGKSTLLRVLSGLLLPTEGQVKIMGTPMADLKLAQRARLMAYMHQDTAMAFDFTVRQVVALGRYPLRSALAALSAADQIVIDEAMARAQCDHLADRPVPHLSGGERQRVMLARALAQETPILFLDEPTASLDVAFTLRLMGMAGSMAKAGKLVIAVMHDLRAAAGACDRVLLMQAGDAIAYGSPRTVLTEAHLAKAYGVNARVFDNPAGGWDYYCL